VCPHNEIKTPLNETGNALRLTGRVAVTNRGVTMILQSGRHWRGGRQQSPGWPRGVPAVQTNLTQCQLRTALAEQARQNTDTVARASSQAQVSRK
jgi:hypothetical protein